MSILLDALKKSEEQRRLGRTPDIHSPPGDPAVQGSTRRRITLILIVLGVVVVAWIVWLQFSTPEPVAGAGPDLAAVTEVPADAGSAGAAAENTTATATNNAEADPVAAAQSAPAPTKPEAHPAAAAAAIEPSTEQRRSRVNQSYTEFEALEKAPAVPTAQPVAEAPASAADLAQVEPSDDERKAREPTTAQEHATEPITYWELPQGVRDNLPELRISVLVYAENPEDRFVLIGGQRLVEKDEVHEGVVLEQIRRDGAVFLYRNYRFLVEG